MPLDLNWKGVRGGGGGGGGDRHHDSVSASAFYQLCPPNGELSIDLWRNLH